MRLLPVRADHVGGGIADQAGAKTQTIRISMVRCRATSAVAALTRASAPPSSGPPDNWRRRHERAATVFSAKSPAWTHRDISSRSPLIVVLVAAAGVVKAGILRRVRRRSPCRMACERRSVLTFIAIGEDGIVDLSWCTGPKWARASPPGLPLIRRR